MPHSKYSGQEIGERGSALYQKVRPEVETPENIGKLLSFDIETGDYELGVEGNFDAQRKLQAKHPGAAIFTVRIGYNAVYTLGGAVNPLTGKVSRTYAMEPVSLQTASGAVKTDFAVVGVDFTGFLTLPEADVAALGLAFMEQIPARFASDAEVYLPVYGATIMWHQSEREVGIVAAGKRPLLGTALLSGQELQETFLYGPLFNDEDLEQKETNHHENTT